MDYSKLHEAQINMMVCKALGLELSSYARIIMQDDATILLSDNKTLVDYCNNPADAWPIIAENKISLIRCVDMWIATPDATVIDGDTSESQDLMYANSWKAPCLAHPNPLRAAMIVFLMVQEGKHD